MRICMVISVPMPPQEGIGHYVWNLSNFLVGQGHQVHIITRGQRGKPMREESGGIPIWRPKFYPIYPLHVHLHGLFVQRLVRRLEANVDAFHLHTPLPPAIRSRRPVLLTIHSIMMADVRARTIDSMFGLLTKLQSPVSSLIEKRLLKVSQGVTAVSPKVVEQMQRFLHWDSGRVEITWNGVDPDFFSPGVHDNPDPNRLLFVGRLAPGKGLEDLAEALGNVIVQYPDVTVSIAGSGPLLSKTRSLFETVELKSHVKLLGHVDSRERLRALYRKAWALVIPSHHESLPTVILESMACGTPVIATSVGAIPDVVNDDVSGLLVPPKTPDRMAKAICRLLGDTELRARLGAVARHTVEEQFSWHAVGKRYLRSYDALLNGSER